MIVSSVHKYSIIVLGVIHCIVLNNNCSWSDSLYCLEYIEKYKRGRKLNNYTIIKSVKIKKKYKRGRKLNNYLISPIFRFEIKSNSKTG